MLEEGRDDGKKESFTVSYSVESGYDRHAVDKEGLFGVQDIACFALACDGSGLRRGQALVSEYLKVD